MLRHVALIAEKRKKIRTEIKVHAKCLKLHAQDVVKKTVFHSNPVREERFFAVTALEAVRIWQARNLDLKQRRANNIKGK